MSFATDGSAAIMASAQLADVGWKAVLGAAVGTYGLIKQHDLQKQMVALSERGVINAERQQNLAESSYSSITLPAFTNQKLLFDRYRTTFARWEDIFTAEAFRLTTYTPDYVTQEGRALSVVQRQFDRAARQRRRQQGKYAAGRVLHDASWFAMQLAQAKIDASNHAYRFEEARKRAWDEFYWKRWADGSALVARMSAAVISGLNGAQAANTAALNSVAQAGKGLQDALTTEMSALNNMSSKWGGLANGAFSFAGDSVAGNQMERAGQSGWVTSVTREHSPTIAVPFSPVAAVY